MLNKLTTDAWGNRLSKYISKEYMDNLGKTLNKEYNEYTVFPKVSEIFNAFKYTDYDDVKVVFLGLDPYIKEGEAYGISFGVRDDCMVIPASLRNIYKEVERDVYNGLLLDFDYSLINWCKQGCLMLNVALTVREKATGSHLKLWEEFTEGTFRALNEKDFCIFVLLGRKAQEYKRCIENKPNFYIIQAPHPAAESYMRGRAGFFNSNIFSNINKILLNNGKEMIKW